MDEYLCILIEIEACIATVIEIQSFNSHDSENQRRGGFSFVFLQRFDVKVSFFQREARYSSLKHFRLVVITCHTGMLLLREAQYSPLEFNDML